MGAYRGLYMTIFIFCKIHPLGGGGSDTRTKIVTWRPPYAPICPQTLQYALYSSYTHIRRLIGCKQTLVGTYFDNK